MNFNIYIYTNKGSRNKNEDFCGYRQDGEQGVYVLADGLGRHGYGEVASKLAVNYILDATRNNLCISDEYLLNMMDGANREIITHQALNPEQRAMRTTIVAGFASENIFKYWGVGDSRLYYFKNGCLYRQSKDHSVSQMAVDLGEIMPEEIRFHDDRSKLLKVLGNDEKLNITKFDSEIKIESGDAFILCSDGFWEYVFETEMELDLVKSDSPRQWCEFMCKRLLRRVTDNNDNFTVLCGIK